MGVSSTPRTPGPPHRRRTRRGYGVGRTTHPGRALHLRLVRARARARGNVRGVALLAVLGPGLLAGLSDDDPAGITTYSVLGADYGYQMLWVLALATGALIVFHELGARLGVVTGKGLAALVRDRFGGRVATALVVTLVVANVGTMCAELAGVAAGAELLAGVPKGVSIPIATLAVSVLVLRGSFHRVEHVLLALASVFGAYLVSGILAHPDWVAAGRGLVVPTMPVTRDALFIAVATVGTTLAPWGLSFIQSYAADKRIAIADLKLERVDVVSGALLTGIIGAFIVMSCAATLHAKGLKVDEAADAARGLEPLAGSLTSTLFGLGLVGAALLAAAIVPLSTAYSVCEGLGRPAQVDDGLREAPVFYGTFAAVAVVASAIVLVPGAPLVSILVGSQALNAVLLLGILPFLMALGVDREVLGDHVLGRFGKAAVGISFTLVLACLLALGALTVLG